MGSRRLCLFCVLCCVCCGEEGCDTLLTELSRMPPRDDRSVLHVSVLHHGECNSATSAGAEQICTLIHGASERLEDCWDRLRLVTLGEIQSVDIRR